MNLEEAIYKRRTIRRFKQDPISIEVLKKLIDYARFAPTGGNIQSLEYVIVNDPETRKKIFPLVKWAAFLPEDERTPEDTRRPTAYIIVLVNTKIKKNADSDVGAAIENILLGATNIGLGTCWMGSINREQIRYKLNIPEFYSIKYLISLGYPDEESVVEPYKNSFKYWKEKNTMHIPKRELKDIIYQIF